MRWATRRHCHIDRAACAWLIRRFLDPDAEFLFVEYADDVPADATPFDMRGVDLFHHGGDCSFETFLRHYELVDPVLWEIAKIVHEADLADERYDAPEAPGLDVLVRGLSMIRDDDELLTLSAPLFDGMYEYRKRALLAGREPAELLFTSDRGAARVSVFRCSDERLLGQVEVGPHPNGLRLRPEAAPRLQLQPRRAPWANTAPPRSSSSTRCVCSLSCRCRVGRAGRPTTASVTSSTPTSSSRRRSSSSTASAR
jgi:hypothetical protein